MRLREVVPCRNGDGGEKEEVVEEVTMAQNQWCPLVNAGFSSPKRVVVVGYALTSKKIKSFLQPKLEGLARYTRNSSMNIRNRTNAVDFFIISGRGSLLKRKKKRKKNKKCKTEIVFSFFGKSSFRFTLDKRTLMFGSFQLTRFFQHPSFSFGWRESERKICDLRSIC